jgi:hypothetical protein
MGFRVETLAEKPRLHLLAWNGAMKLDREDWQQLDINDWCIKLGGKYISQDLTYSALKYRAIRDGVDDLHSISTVMELGAGYGRNAYSTWTCHVAI